MFPCGDVECASMMTVSVLYFMLIISGYLATYECSQVAPYECSQVATYKCSQVAPYKCSQVATYECSQVFCLWWVGTEDKTLQSGCFVIKHNGSLIHVGMAYIFTLLGHFLLMIGLMIGPTNVVIWQIEKI